MPDPERGEPTLETLRAWMARGCQWAEWEQMTAAMDAPAVAHLLALADADLDARAAPVLARMEAMLAAQDPL